MSDPLNRPLTRTLNRHPYSDTLTRPASTDATMVASSIHKRSSLPTDSTEDPHFYPTPNRTLKPTLTWLRFVELLTHYVDLRMWNEQSSMVPISLADPD